MLQRIYGTAWASKADLEAYLNQIEEARKRDHRRVGRELGFTLSEDIGQGIPIFFPKGEMVRYLMESYVREAQTRYGYQHVWTVTWSKKTSTSAPATWSTTVTSCSRSWRTRASGCGSSR